MMQAQVISEYGSHSIFKTIDLPIPSLKPGYVLIRVKATSVNPIDYKIRSGQVSGITPIFPAILHGDVAGTVEAVGDEITEFKKGDEVYGCAGGVRGESGALSEFMLADARLLAKKPQQLTMAEAAALPLVSITAWEALFDKIAIQKDMSVLIHAGAGGVGHIAVQLALWAGAKVYTTVSNDKKQNYIHSLSKDIEVINYRYENVQDYVNRLTSGVGFDAVIDTVGDKNIDTSIAAIRLYGNVVSVLSRSSHDLSMLQAKSGSLHIVFMLLPLLYNVRREMHGKILAQIAQLADKKIIKPLVDPQLFSFEEVGAAHAYLESGKAIGKVVIVRN